MGHRSSQEQTPEGRDFPRETRESKDLIGSGFPGILRKGLFLESLEHRLLSEKTPPDSNVGRKVFENYHLETRDQWEGRPLAHV